jgi:hypothetical protein
LHSVWVDEIGETITQLAGFAVAQTAALLHFLIDTLVVAAATRAVYPPQPPRGSIRNCRLYLSKPAVINTSCILCLSPPNPPGEHSELAVLRGF